MKKQTNILIIGGPNVGKTHFGGQLYGRLQTRNSFYKIVSPPENLVIFKEVLESLNDGKSAGHTNVAANDVLELEIENNKGARSLFSFPDYGGEQVRSIVNDRRINKTWKDQIEKSDAWMLFIRPDDIPAIEDIVNRGLPAQDVLEKRNKDVGPLVLSRSAFYIELIQMLLYTKKSSTNSQLKSPLLTIVLSCWDCVEEHVKGKLPKDVLKEKLPSFYSYIAASWRENAFTVIGLSSTEKTLSDKTPDQEYIRKGPENFGYIITENGQKERDLTLSIARFGGTN